MRDRYRALLERALRGARASPLPFLAAMAASAILAFPFGRYLPGLGQDFFPSVDAGQIRLHLRARTGLRIEETAALCDRVEATIRSMIPANGAREHRRQHRRALQRHQSRPTRPRRPSGRAMPTSS